METSLSGQFVVVDIPLTVEPASSDVSVWYKGGQEMVSGQAPPDADAVMTIIRSMETPPMTLARKGRVVLFWMTVKKFHVENMPGVYQLATSAPLSAILESIGPEEAARNQIGYAALREGWEVKLTSGAASEDDMDVLFNGLVKLKDKIGLYRILENAIRVKPDGAFSNAFPISDATTVGKYTVLAYAIKDGTIIGKGQGEFAVNKIGLVNWLTAMASHRSGIYGIIAVVIAFATGIVVSIIFKGKGGH
ncbi:TIGR02186 family protein [Candidatus Poribacteria bacterium]|nr:TIGR02186 family protein [Candidatus Poribacteria bacterium]